MAYRYRIGAALSMWAPVFLGAAMGAVGCSSAACKCADAAPNGDAGNLSDAIDGPHDGTSDAAPRACSPGSEVQYDVDSVDCDWTQYVGASAGTLSFPPSSSAVDDPFVLSIQLETPMQAGQSYGLSVLLAEFGWQGTLEFWGSNSPCGPGLEQLHSEPLATKLICSDTAPAAAYTSVLIVFRRTNNPSSAAESFHPVVTCPMGTCP